MNADKTGVKAITITIGTDAQEALENVVAGVGQYN